MLPGLLGFGLLLATGLASVEGQTKPAEFSPGRQGLALSGGHSRGVPLGELAGWSATFWFQANDASAGDLFGIALDVEEGRFIRLSLEEESLRLTGPAISQALRRSMPDGWSLTAPVSDLDKWHHVAITYQQANGPWLYLDGKLIDSGERRWMGYATSFDHYYFGAPLVSEGNYGASFDGLIDDFMLYERPLSPEEVEASFQGEALSARLVAFNDFENVSHRDLASLDAIENADAFIEEGRELFQLHCIACHSKDGISPPPNPLARAFGQHAMLNGADPYSMFQTLTYGFRNMMAAPQLNPVERYKVIHYIREKVVRPNAPELYVELDDTYTETMPSNPDGLRDEVERVEALAKSGYLRDYGDALITPVNSEAPENTSRNALVVNLGDETTIGWDLGSMRTIGAWQGGFLDYSFTLHHKLRANGLPTARFEFLPGLEGWRWAWNGRAEIEAPERMPNTIFPEEQVRYRGHYPNGSDIVVSFDVQGREVLESARYESTSAGPVVHRRLTIQPGSSQIELVSPSFGDAELEIDGDRAKIETSEFTLGAWLQSKTRGPRWRLSERDELVLRIPASKTPIHLNIALASDSGEAGDDWAPRPQATDLAALTRGGPRRWEQTHTLKGKRAVDTFQGYALDSVPVPFTNAYNTWMRTASLASFPDGRLAVATLSGDVWIVSGVDDSLEAVTWQRFAAGLYEPMGMKVVDGVLTAITRGRIVKLHDYNEDGEADFYQAFFNEDEPSNGWHAYSCGLVLDDAGNYYYARTGGFSDWSIPGGLVRVSADGKRSEVLGVGMRVPNGIGRLPNGSITFGDNQGTYVPASKVSIASIPGSFHGAGLWDKRDGNFDTNAIVDPIVYMPQELDSSSGSQLWIEEDRRFGPLGGQFFHVSYGRARAMTIFVDEVGDTVQGAVFPLPLKMESGTLRMAKSPADGQLYFSGLTGWQAGATREGSIQRLRYTGDEGLYLLDANAREGKLTLRFNRPLNANTVARIGQWKASMWNYKWSRAYGSPMFKVTEPGVEGIDDLELSDARIGSDGTELTIVAPDLSPCHTLKLEFSVEDRDGKVLDGPVYFTIHELVDN